MMEEQNLTAERMLLRGLYESSGGLDLREFSLATGISPILLGFVLQTLMERSCAGMLDGVAELTDDGRKWVIRNRHWLFSVDEAHWKKLPPHAVNKVRRRARTGAEPEAVRTRKRLRASERLRVADVLEANRPNSIG